MTKGQNEIVVKSNQLIEAQYKLTQREQKIMIYLTSQIHKDDEDFKMYKLPIKQFCEMMGLAGSPKYDELKQITDGLQKKILKIKKENKIYSVSWLSLVVYNANEGTVSMRFDPFLKPYLIQLRKEFTRYEIKNIMNMKSGYSIRIYELLRQYLQVGQRKIVLDELREYIGLDENEYSVYADLKRKVIKVAEKEINAKSDILINFSEIKERRKVVALVFTIQKRDDHLVLRENGIERLPIGFDKGDGQGEFDLLPEETKEFKVPLLSLGVSKKQIEKILLTYTAERIQKNIEFVLKKKNEGEINKSLAGFAYKSITEDWASLYESTSNDLPLHKPKKSIRTEMLPKGFEQGIERENIRRNGTLEERRQLYWQEFGSQEKLEETALKWLEINKMIYPTKEKTINKTCEVFINENKKRSNLGIELIKAEDIINPELREMYKEVLKDSLIHTM